MRTILIFVMIIIIVCMYVPGQGRGGACWHKHVFLALICSWCRCSLKLSAFLCWPFSDEVMALNQALTRRASGARTDASLSSACVKIATRCHVQCAFQGPRPKHLDLQKLLKTVPVTYPGSCKAAMVLVARKDKSPGQASLF